MVYITLFIIFFKIGLFSFGGGLAMLPIIEQDMMKYGWLNHQDFLDIITISQMTPGPIAINCATFAGFKVAGFWGSVFATIGIASPSIIIMVILSAVLTKFEKSKSKKIFFYGLMPVTAALILYSAFLIGKSTIYIDSLINIKAIVGIVVCFAIINKVKTHPIMIIVLSASAGLIVF